MTTTLFTVLSKPANGLPTGTGSRALACAIPAYAADAMSPAFPTTAGVVAWRKTTAAGIQAMHRLDAAHATPVGSGGSG